MKGNFKAWIKAAGIRALKTLAQSAVAAIGTTATLGGVDWKLVASTAALAAVLSPLTSVAGLPPVVLTTRSALLTAPTSNTAR